jgi:hypothetical protein
MAYSSFDPFRHGRTFSDAFQPYTSAVNQPRPEWDVRAAGPRYLVADGAAAFGSYFQPGDEKLPVSQVWDENMETLPGLKGLGGVLDDVKNAVNKAQSAASNPSSALSSAGIDMNQLTQAIIPPVKSAVQTGVTQGFQAAWPTIQAKIQPLQDKAVAGIATLTVLQALTLAGVGYLAYKAMKKGGK